MADETTQTILELWGSLAGMEEAVVAMIEEFAYTGFNPKVTFKELMKIADGNLKALTADVVKILTFVLIRGTRPDRNRVKKTMSDQGAREIEALIERYKIKLETVPTKQEDISLGRIVATFPHLFAGLIHRNIKNENLRLPGADKAGLLPKQLMFPAAPALIPKSGDWDYLFNDWAAYSANFSRIINKKTPRDNVNDNKSAGLESKNQTAYGNIARNNSIFTDEQRANILSKMGITLNSSRKAEELTDVSGNAEPEGKNKLAKETTK